uniref:Uncharacterized protein n=1 Tax=Anopheles braziliensis TaxID=58242 RepID=A0A2M3ZIV7_9DIPT
MQIKQEKLSFSDVDETDEESDGQTASNSRQTLLENLKGVIKQEKTTSSEDDSDSSESTTPTKVKSEPPERDCAPSDRPSVAAAVAVKIEPPEKSPRGNEKVVEALTTLEDTSTIVKGTGFPAPLQSKLADYLQRCPNVRPTIQASNQGTAVELDLSNPDEEAWIVQCPATIDPHVVLLNRKLNLSASQATVKKCPIPLETTVRRNTTQQVISVLSDCQMKSFVPAGFIRITETLPEMSYAEQLDQQVWGKDCEVRVPFPDNIPERHPLLGNDFRTLLAIPDRVQKRLSLARQKADLFYTSPQLTRFDDSTNHSSQSHTEEPVTTKARKRRAAQENEPKATKLPTDDAIPPMTVVDEIVVKQEPMTPTKRKRKNESKQAVAIAEAADRSVVVAPVAPKKEVTEATEDDISWLLNI